MHNRRQNPSYAYVSILESVPAASTVHIGVARGCTGCTPMAETKKFGGQIYGGKVVSAPQGRVHRRVRAKSILGNWEIWAVGEVISAVLARVLRATTKNNFFGEEKCTARQNPGYAYESASTCLRLKYS